jgi:hypothetical protein
MTTAKVNLLEWLNRPRSILFCTEQERAPEIVTRECRGM